MSLIIKSISFAKEAHKNQFRKDNITPYITHPAEVAKTLCLYCEPTDVMIATAWLHDVVEDTPHTHKDILYNFGQSIYKLVFDLTNKYTKENKPSWNREKRKKAEHVRLNNCGLETQIIKACDRICNLQDCNGFTDGFNFLYMEESRDLYNNLTKIHNLEIGGLMESMLNGASVLQENEAQ